MRRYIFPLLLITIAAAGGVFFLETREILPNPPDRTASRILSNFSLTHVDLEKIVRDEPDGVRDRILKEPNRFLELLDPVLDLPWKLTVLVDKDNPLPEGYEPASLTALSRYGNELVLNRDGLHLDSVAVPDLRTMVRTAHADGVILDITSTYRSEQYQGELFARYSRQHGLEQARRFSAEPGTSQHQLGTAIDFGRINREFETEAAGQWLFENAWRFGFSLSYPDRYESVTGYIYEPWHYRYIGRPATRLEQEFFDGIQQYLLEFLARHGDLLRSARS